MPSEATEVDGLAGPPAEIGEDLEGLAASSQTFKSLTKALQAARGKLLDRSLRNKLINTNLASPRARQVRVFDEASDQVFPLIQGGRILTFAPGVSAKAQNAESKD